MTKRIFLAVVSMAMGISAEAQEWGLEYVTECQTNFRGAWNLVNLLRLYADIRLGESCALEASTLTAFKTNDEGIIAEDLQGFSNIESWNIPFALSTLNLHWDINEKSCLYAGIRTMNEDYFASPVTSYFLHSSAATIPTISGNLIINDYPLTTMGLHYRYEEERFAVQSSLYNGMGHYQFVGADNVWRITPRSEGLFMLAQGEYKRNGGAYFVGGCLHTGVAQQHGVMGTLWGYLEQSLTEKISLVAHLSHALGEEVSCRDFVAIGGVWSHDKQSLGIYADCVNLVDDREFATELTYTYEFTKNLSLQPSLHLIHNQGGWHTAGLLRLTYCFSAE